MKQPLGLAWQPATPETHSGARNLRKISKSRDSTLCKFNFCLLTRQEGVGGGHFMQRLIDLLPAWLYSNIYWNKKSALNINPACWTCTVIISILYFHLLVYIKSMLLICASPWFFWGLENCSGDRTAGLPVQYHLVWVFFELVNIMQPQNCTTRLRRLVWTSFFLCVVFFFLSHLFFLIFFFFFIILGVFDWERSAFFFSCI